MTSSTYNSSLPSHPPWLPRSFPTRAFGDDDDQDNGYDIDIPLRIRPINSNMDRLLYGAGPTPSQSSGMPKRLNYGFGNQGGGWGSGGCGNGLGGGGRGGSLNSWAPPSPAMGGRDSIPRTMARAGPSRVGMSECGDGTSEGKDGEEIKGEGEKEEENIPLKLKNDGKICGFDALLAGAAGNSTSRRQTDSPAFNAPFHTTTPTPAPNAPVVGATSPLPPLPLTSAVTGTPVPPSAPLHHSDPPQSPREMPLTPRPVPPPLDLSLADLPCSDSEGDEDDVNPPPLGPNPEGQGLRKPYKARGQTPNRRLTITELENMPDTELLAQALTALGYKQSHSTDYEEEEEKGEGLEVDQFNSEFGGQGVEVGSMGMKRRGGGRWGDGWNGGMDGESQRGRSSGGVKLKKGSGNFGMEWGVV